MRIKWLLKIALGFVLVATLASAAAVVRWHQGAKSALSIASALLVAILAIAAFITLNWLSEASAQSVFQNWATEHGYTVLRFRKAFVTGGAFTFWTTSRGQAVYFITVRDQQGTERNACVRCGSSGGGVLFSNKIEVKWIDEPNPT